MMANLAPRFVFSPAVFHADDVIQAQSAYFFLWLDSVILDATMVAETPAILLIRRNLGHLGHLLLRSEEKR
jgi:hypothetical protein